MTHCAVPTTVPQNRSFNHCVVHPASSHKQSRARRCMNGAHHVCFCAEFQTVDNTHSLYTARLRQSIVCFPGLKHKRIKIITVSQRHAPPSCTPKQAGVTTCRRESIMQTSLSLPGRTHRAHALYDHRQMHDASCSRHGRSRNKRETQ